MFTHWHCWKTFDNYLFKNKDQIQNTFVAIFLRIIQIYFKRNSTFLYEEEIQLQPSFNLIDFFFAKLKILIFYNEKNVYKSGWPQHVLLDYSLYSKYYSYIFQVNCSILVIIFFKKIDLIQQRILNKCLAFPQYISNDAVIMQDISSALDQVSS